MIINVVKIFIPTTFAFFAGIAITPIATFYFYKYKMWKKKSRNDTVTSLDFKKIHATIEKEEISVPCVGGIIVWLSILLSISIFYFLSFLFPTNIFSELNFFSRSQTLLPLGVLILGAFVGLIDDILEIKGKSHITRNTEWYTRAKILIIVLCSALAGFWFFYKLGITSIHVPFYGDLSIGMAMIPFFIIVALGTFSGGVIDGIDGLSGGVLASIFGAYTAIAFAHNQIDLATLCGVITGAILAFLWFNIPPARFYMGETGMMPLTLILSSIAFLTDTVLILPIIAFPLVITSFSSAIQIFARKFFKKKVFLIAPLHHHFEAIGWSRPKITMRYWVLSIMFAIIGVILAIVS